MMTRVLFFLALFLAQLTRANGDERKRLMLNVGGPVGEVRTIAFSADSQRLYAAGSGKVVNVWNINMAGDVLRATPDEPLRWEVARGHRGVIYALDCVRNEAAQPGLLAIGGQSTRAGNGDIAVFDTVRRRIEYLLPRRRPDAVGPGPQTGHMQTVASISFSPSGKQLVTMSLDGEVRLWSNQGADSRILQAASGNGKGQIQCVRFLSENRIAYPTPVPNAHPQAWRLTLINTDQPNPASRVLQHDVFWDGIVDIALSRDGQYFAAADHFGKVILFENKDQPEAWPLNRKEAIRNGLIKKEIASLSFGPRGLLAITTADDFDGNCWLEIWQTSADKTVPPSKWIDPATAAAAALEPVEDPNLDYPLGQGPFAYASAFSPDGTMLAVTRADRSSVMLIPVRNPAVPPGHATYPLDVERALQLTGRGHDPDGVAFVGEDGYRIAISTDGDPERTYFDLKTLQFPEGEIPAESRPVAATRWRLVPQPVDNENHTQELQLIPPGVVRSPCQVLLEDTRSQGVHLMHTWLTDENGSPYGVAVATERMDGIFLYDLPAQGRCRLLRYLRDHTGTISAVSISHDGRYLVSSAADQTVKVWSLAGLRGVNQSFPREDAWGATFEVENDRLVVKTALPQGITAHRNLLAGDVITKIIVAGPDGEVEQNDPQVMRQTIAELALWDQVGISSTRNGQPQEDFLMVPGWEPLATLYIDAGGEWAMWTPQGVYDASAEGDKLFGWHINVSREEDPQYFRAEQFRGELEQPDVMRQLLISGSLQAALVAVAAAQPREVNDIAADVPRVRIDSPVAGANIPAGQQITVDATVTYPLGSDNYIPRLYVNQIPGGAPNVQPQEAKVRGLTALSGLLSMTGVRGWDWWPGWAVYSWQVDKEYLYSWSIPPDGSRNLIKVSIDESDAVDALFQDATVQVTAAPDPEQPGMKVHLFSLSAEKYAPGQDLKWCNDDAEGVARLLREHAGPHYEIGLACAVNDEESPNNVSRVSVKQAVDRFRKDMKDVPSQDLLVVFVAGHGVAYGSDYYFISPTQRVINARNPRDRNWIQQTGGIPWDHLRSLAEIPCRKLFVLDTCYSGNVAEAEGTQAEKNSKRPLLKMQAMVFSATAHNQQAKENPDGQNGLFTSFLLQGCNGAADGTPPHKSIPLSYTPVKDDAVDLPELVSYVTAEVPKVNPDQEPKCSPVHLLNFIDLPLF